MAVIIYGADLRPKGRALSTNNFPLQLLACVPFPALKATSNVAILQAPDGKDSG